MIKSSRRKAFLQVFKETYPTLSTYYDERLLNLKDEVQIDVGILTAEERQELLTKVREADTTQTLLFMVDGKYLYSTKLFLTDTNEVLTMMSDEKMKIFKEPPEDIRERNIENRQLFNSVMVRFGDHSDPIHAANNVGRLLNKEYHSHPMIHRGYFDSMEDNILYVKCGITGKKLRKDRSVLTNEGYFISSSPVEEYSLTSDWQLKAYKRHVLTQTKLAKPTFIYVEEYKTWLNFDITEFQLAISANHFAHILRAYYGNFAQTINLPYVPENGDEFNVERFTTYFNQTFRIENNLDYTRIVKRTVDDNENGENIDNTFFKTGFPASLNKVGFIKTSQKGFVFLNSENNYVNEINHRHIQNTEVIPNDENPYFSLCLMVQTPQILKVSHKTSNNKGSLLSYNTKVDTTKVPFKMLPSEETYFGREDELQKKRMEEWRQKGGLRPKRHPHTQPIFMGIEIEAVMTKPFESTPDFSKFVADVSNSGFGDHMIMKSDSSLGSNYGLEIVTIPATLGYHKKMFDEHFYKIENNFENRIMGTDKCGIHIHIAKNCFTTMDLGKFMAFINSRDNATFIDNIAGRSNNAYALKVPLAGKNTKGVDRSVRVVKSACIDGHLKNGLSTHGLPPTTETRRVAVNITNKHTIEVRIFKSSQRQNNLFMKMEFCEALVKFVRCHSMQQMTTYDFVQFILDSANKKEYPYLVRWLASKNYVGHTKKKVKGKTKLFHVYSENKIPVPETPFHKIKKETN
jgi:hypothetical protein